MTIMPVVSKDGYVLTYDTEDVEDIRLAARADIRDATPPFATAVHRELTGEYHLDLHIDFKHGKKALWLKVEDVEGMQRMADLRFTMNSLTTALDAEGVDPQLASRIMNRMLFGTPQGLHGVHVRPAAEPEEATP